ncbi:hypothetical protein EHI8A_003220 [Entamoeba histolytica HM-1:IMSS-B]|uniref:Uncharacterized protein n=6 Tax=Entamoeba histolytica TaxID=5759 RepID=C4LWH0_ENTH1|nr:hypothetical protein EHI_096580 [Entamoeba histolytica HM-1:IMSS]EMD47654.1 Hypothetical protein EHI5A_005350 [Entamoeba histolytica KU27]EMH77800.1 hypothetical protein EHI8A_003220 [Entamoeba histolytica HM-1:IMSS-B]EMS11769.1 hypothetical protein KM1_003890 [Entamoeba histolytica HM-3:IMSS]ENY64795.1 hypothetical protein EHI7A_001350 [Entamoeba histolytica HM-1:IMSS-A]GAT93055.1 hypothetical protein CL6EHI_096580 [Entamoeba histolytica]|eukprot:XP_656934.1 hypothetical protein EHI_096580 [Entamoeba histolytica HM-1:IMSS]
MSTLITPPSPRWNPYERTAKTVSPEERSLFCYCPNIVAFPLASVSPRSTSSDSSTTEFKGQSKLTNEKSISESFISHTTSETSTPRKGFIGRNRAKSGLVKTVPIEEHKELHSCCHSIEESKLSVPSQLTSLSSNTSISIETTGVSSRENIKEQQPSDIVSKKVVPSISIEN